MPKTIFDLGAITHKDIERETIQNWFWYRPLCPASWLWCFNVHKPEICPRKKILEEHMWTRRR